MQSEYDLKLVSFAHEFTRKYLSCNMHPHLMLLFDLGILRQHLETLIP